MSTGSTTTIIIRAIRPLRASVLGAGLIVAAVTGSLPHPQSGEKDQADTLIGLWGTEQITGQAVRGLLVIDARADPWRATVGGYQADVRRRGDTVAFVLPAGGGEFRGRKSAGDQSVIAGHWIQPGTFGPYNQRYASPVELLEKVPGVFQGTVSPLEPKLSFYISIRRSGDGTLSAFIKNPEANYFNRRNYTVSLRGDSVFLDHPQYSEPGTYDRETDRLFIPLLYNYPPLPFTRRHDRDAIGFFPSVAPKTRSYVYKPPVDDDHDGWKVGTIAEAGIDVSNMERFIQKILDADPSPDNPLNIQSLLIARHGKLVLEEYFFGFDKDRTHDMRSASKTIAPILVGIARDRGVRIGPETRIYMLFNKYRPFANWDERKNTITLEDLVNMASGLAIDDGDDDSPGNEATLQSQTTDWYKYTLDLPMVRDPGGSPVYGSANINLAGGALVTASGRWFPELFHDYLARPLGIATYQINLMPNGDAYTGGGLYLRPRDQLKIGQLYLSRGEWNGRAVVSGEWVERSTVRHGDLAPRMEADTAHGYGYAWHFRNCTVGGRSLDYYWAGGNGGQLIIVIPRLDMVVGFTGGDYTEYRKYLRWEIEFLPGEILTGVRW